MAVVVVFAERPGIAPHNNQNHHHPPTPAPEPPSAEALSLFRCIRISDDTFSRGYSRDSFVVNTNVLQTHHLKSNQPVQL